MTQLTAVLDIHALGLPIYLLLPCRSLAQQPAHLTVPQIGRQPAGWRCARGMVYLHVRFDPSSSRRAIAVNHLRRVWPDAGG